MAVLFFIIGAVLGSFLLVLSTRGVKGESFVKGRSKCDNCGHILSPWELIPIFSYLFLLGKCKHCKSKISVLTIITEIVMGAAFTFSYLFYGISYEMFMFDTLFSLLITIFITDFTSFIILDSPLVVSGIIILILDLIYKTPLETLMYFLSGISLFVVMYLIKLLGDLLFKKESLGGGDIKLAFIIGFALGFRLSLIAIILSTFLALPYSFAYFAIKKNNEVPYGPFLAASLFLVYIFNYKFISLLELIVSKI